MGENDTGDPSTSDDPPTSRTEALEGENSRSCSGCLLYSSSLRDARRNPICIGLGRAERRVYSLVGESERDGLKEEGPTLADFKYACVGYSIHKETASRSERPVDGDELPICVGLEFLADRRARPASGPSKLEQLEQNDEGPPVLVRPPPVRSPTTVNGMSGEGFSSRFIRSAGLVASAVVKNVFHVAHSVKTSVDDIVHGRRPK